MAGRRGGVSVFHRHILVKPPHFQFGTLPSITLGALGPQTLFPFQTISLISFLGEGRVAAPQV